ncbi:type VII secretion integral membrane protein EccD [Candidatus Mycobacterium wuenschmannii]|uniref:Type VII secretion integral membrane protein EccD n=1 Tax=Candidatus Mycobacterium wuenschmannii TaxID=3027808 RepID=A0ABY8VVG8_9MYCO|nr:type VII secretion integral membrane protein EccD [Candidatus Mycobacterium wuenschmannii]WIM87635.1 type VII secretion integral membrane protein EccD [Candidatus Mycobacterium wuenschmannii]
MSEVRRVSIHADAARVDAVVSAAEPVGSLIPAMVDALTQHTDFDAGHVARRYRLVVQGRVVAPSKTLSELLIADGMSLTLTHEATAFLPPPCDDAAEAVSTEVAGIERRWSRPAAQSVAALVGGGFSVVGAMVLLRNGFGPDGGQRLGCVGVAATIGLLALLAAVTAYRVFSEQAAGLALGVVAVGCGGLAGSLAVPGGPGAPNALFAAAAAATSATVMRTIGCHTVIFTTLACSGTACTAAAFAAVITGGSPAVIGAGLAAASLAVIEAAPSISVALARLSAEEPQHARRAHAWLTSLIAAPSAAAALGVVCAASRMSTSATIFAVVVGSVMILRARTHHDVTRAVSLIVCGSVCVGAAFLAFAVAHPRHTLPVAGLCVALGVATLGLGGNRVNVSPGVRRSIELVESAAFAAVAPLALWLSGLLGAIRGLDLS